MHPLTIRQDKEGNINSAKNIFTEEKFDSNFDNVKPEAYYYEPVGIAKKLGIAVDAENGFEPGEYPDRI